MTCQIFIPVLNMYDYNRMIIFVNDVITWVLLLLSHAVVEVSRVFILRAQKNDDASERERNPHLGFPGVASVHSNRVGNRTSAQWDE